MAMTVMTTVSPSSSSTVLVTVSLSALVVRGWRWWWGLTCPCLRHLIPLLPPLHLSILLPLLVSLHPLFSLLSLLLYILPFPYPRGDDEAVSWPALVVA
jgi:hypothetical protein